MTRYAFIIILLGCFTSARASHITGGEMYYSFIGVVNGEYQYTVTLKLLMRCNSGRQFNDPSIMSVFSKSTSSRVKDIPVNISRRETIQLTNPDKCITNPPIVCYEVAYYEFTVSLPASSDGYVVACQVVYRVAGINNLMNGYGNVGATYTAEIPGSGLVGNGLQNKSARFIGSDLVVTCANSSFTYSFAATDDDGDKLKYSFCNAYEGGSNSGANTGNPAAPPPYHSVPYASEYGSSSPLGSTVQIDPNTGLITGLAPKYAGIYVVTVCVEEIRNNVVIATQRKDIQLNIAPCTIAGAILKPEYMLCRDTKTINLSNLSTSPLIASQYWELSDAQRVVLFTSTSATVSYAFPDTGIYNIKLVINRGRDCSDSTTSIARVYPGFVPGYTVNGICFTKPTRFTDISSTVYGQVNYWNWELGESSTLGNSSNQQNPVITYSRMGVKPVRLIAGNSVGCRDTVSKQVAIFDKPPITLRFRDTLICVNDEVQLLANGNGNFSWTPNSAITNSNTASPVVSPSLTTTYFVNLDDDGCLNRDSVKVRVTDHVTLQAMNDTTICQGDAIQLRIASDGFKYTWTPALTLNNPLVKNPIATTNITTTYEVTAIIGGCLAQDQLMVTTISYPLANAGPDTTICHNTVARLHAGMDGKSFTWSPASTLNNRNILNPEARPGKTTAYIFSAYDIRGCPKAGSDTVTVTVLPNILPFAGNDTSVVIGQALQLKATGGVGYLWSPNTGLTAANIASPVALYNESSEGLKYKVLIYNEAGCVDSAFLRVRVFQGEPAVFVPNAFTPDGDGRNDVLRPIAAGIQRMDYLTVYNRWGQLVFGGNANTGWDGRLSGRPQDSGVYVWVVKALDYKGNPYLIRGTVMLIR
ncbi:MAG: gliding motility-associated C-terminal domain-containing protein [Chitinophagaceae bacterium]